MGFSPPLDKASQVMEGTVFLQARCVSVSVVYELIFSSPEPKAHR